MAQLHDAKSALRTSPPAPFVEWRHSLPSRVADLELCVDTLMRFIRLFVRKFPGAEESESDIEIALHEALANAVIHGNREDPHKRVYMVCRCSMDGEITISVQDEGYGFDTHALRGPTDPKNRLLPQGRGIHLMRALMDEVSFEENGRLVCMRKKLPVQTSEAPFVPAAASSVPQGSFGRKKSAQQPGTNRTVTAGVRRR